MTNSIVPDADGARTARTYYVAVLVVWSSLSVAGNALHALESGAGTLAPVLSAVIATIPPIALIAITHLLILQLRSSRGTWKRLLTPLALMVSSFALSFTALRELAVMAGFPPLLAPLMAVIIDGPVVQASAALYYDAIERRKDAPEAVVALPTAASTIDIPIHVAQEAGACPVTSAASIDDHSVEHADHDEVVDDERSEPLVEPQFERPVNDEWEGSTGRMEPPVEGDLPPRQVNPDEIAIAQLVKERANTKASELIVARALMYRDQGYSQELAAEGVGMHRTTVARWEAVREEVLAHRGLAAVQT